MIVGPDRTLTHSSSRKILRLLKMPVEPKSTAHLGMNCYCLVVVNGKRVLKTKTLLRQPRAVGDCSSLLHNSGKQSCAFIRESLQGIAFSFVVMKFGSQLRVAEGDDSCVHYVNSHLYMKLRSFRVLER